MPVDEAVEVGHVRHHVVGDDHVGALAFGDAAAGEVGAEELGERGYPGRLGRGRLLGAGSMPSTGTPASTKLRSR